MTRRQKKVESSIQVQHQPHITQKQFLDIYRGHEREQLDFGRRGEEEHLYGFVVAYTITPNGSPYKDHLVIGATYPHKGDPRTDSACHVIYFSDIIGVQLLPKAEAA